MRARQFQWLCACAMATLIAVPISLARAAPSSETVKALQQGIIAFNSGKAKTAVTNLTTVIQSDKRSVKDLAKALHYRAKAYYALKKPGLTIADLNSALWLKQLSPLAREDAVRLKQRALQTTGVIPASTPADNQKPTHQQQQIVTRSQISAGSIAPAKLIKPWATTAIATQSKPKPVASKILTAKATKQSPVLPAWTTSAKISRALKIPTTVKSTTLKPLAPTPTRVASRPLAAVPLAAKPVIPAFQITKAPVVPAPAPKSESAPWPTVITSKPAKSVPTVTSPQLAKGIWQTNQTVAAKPAPTSPEPQQIAVAEPATSSQPSIPETNAVEATTDLFSTTPAVSGILELTGLQDSPTPTKSRLLAAEELAKRRRERIRQHNKMYAAGQTVAQNVDQRAQRTTP